MAGIWHSLFVQHEFVVGIEILMASNTEVPPPWAAYPGYPPGDGFWRQAGEPWFTLTWKPYWDSLGEREREAYLVRWNVPAEWRKFYFDAEFSRWLDGVDDV
jgi:hypothetical protein